MRIVLKTLAFLLLLGSANSYAAKPYEIVFENGAEYHIYLDIVADFNLLTQIEGETVFKQLTREICGTSDCTTRFWLSKEYAAKTATLDDQARKSMVAEYRQESGRQTMISHHAIERREAQFAEATCVKKVFNLYCLGGDSADLPQHSSQKIEGEIDRRYFGDDTAVLSVRGKVAEVIRIYSDMSWLKFGSTEGKISGIYGQPADLSHYPDYANDQSSRATAIRLERAQVVNAWDQGDWSIRWSWLGDNGRLSYTHKALKDVLEAADPGEGF